MPGPLHSALPALLREMADAFGIAAVMNFIRWYGNRRLYIPKNTAPDGHDLVLRLGRATADWLVQHHGDQTVIVPRAVDMLRAQRDREIRAARGSKSAAELAMRYGLHERQIWRVWSDQDCESEGQPQDLLTKLG